MLIGPTLLVSAGMRLDLAVRAMSMRGGIDLGGTKIQAVIVDAEGKPQGDARGPTPFDDGPSGVAAAMADGPARGGRGGR